MTQIQGKVRIGYVISPDDVEAALSGVGENNCVCVHKVFFFLPDIQ